MNLDTSDVEAYLTHRLGRPAQVLVMQALGDEPKVAGGEQRQLKTYGYGRPVLIQYRVDGGERRAVLRTMAASPFGHERRADRAAGLLLSYDTSNDLPQHVRALDVGVLLPDGQLASISDGGEFFLLTDYAEGALYADDLARLRDTGCLTDRDLRRAESLAHYLAEIHAAKRDDPTLYRRAVRDLVGSGEGIFGLADSYPPDFSLLDAGWLERVEQACVHWRWRLKTHPERLAQTHGDFHPFNVLFGDDVAFWLFDRSRGGWGEPADDVTCMAINYLFFSLQRSGELAPPFEQLWDVFWRTYLAQTADDDLLERVAPFFVWRALVVASPAWYNVADAVRVALFRFIEAVLDAARFDPTRQRVSITVENRHTALAQPTTAGGCMDMPHGWAIWFTGPPASGKTTLARAVRRVLQERGISTILLDSDELRRLTIANATYAPAERDWFYNRLVELAVWLVRAGEHVLIAATGSRRCYRNAARTQLGPRFVEVWVRCPFEICRARDPKELYGRAAAGVIHNLPGVDVPYEAPEAPEVIVDTDQQTVEQAAETVLASLALLECFVTTSA